MNSDDSDNYREEINNYGVQYDHDICKLLPYRDFFATANKRIQFEMIILWKNQLRAMSHKSASHNVVLMSQKGCTTP